MQTNTQRSFRHRQTSRRVNAWILTGYSITTPVAVFLKAWETVHSRYLIGWLAKTNTIVWDTVTLAGAIGVLALGVREMVLAYFMRKEYEEDLAALLQNQEAQAEMVKAQAEATEALLAEGRERRAADAAQIQVLTDTVNQLLEQNRQLIERLDRQSNDRTRSDQ